MSKQSKILKELIEDRTNPERIFPILNKLDRIWSEKVDKPFCEIYEEITKGKKLTDLQFTQKMEEYIEKHNIR